MAAPSVPPLSNLRSLTHLYYNDLHRVPPPLHTFLRAQWKGHDVVLAQAKVVEDFDAGVALQQRIASSGPLVPVLGYCADTHQAVYPVSSRAESESELRAGFHGRLTAMSFLHPTDAMLACEKYFSRGSADAYAAMPHLTLKERLNILTVSRSWPLPPCVFMTARA